MNFEGFKVEFWRIFGGFFYVFQKISKIKLILTGAFSSKFYAEFESDLRFSWNLLKDQFLMIYFFIFSILGQISIQLLGPYTRTHPCLTVL